MSNEPSKAVVQGVSGRGAALGAALTLAGAMAGHALMETARDALFLSHLPAQELPWMYLGIAVGSVVLARAHRSFSGLDGRRVLSTLLFAAGAGTLGLWWATEGGTPASMYALYVWTGVYATVVVSQFWLVVGHAYTIAQAKRVYSWIGSGGVIGAIVGSLAARALVERYSPRALILWAAGTLVLSGVAPLLGLRPDAVGPVAKGAAEPLGPGRLRRSTRVYLLSITALVVLMAATTTMVDYMFKSSVAAHVAPERMASFFASLNLGLNSAALAVQLLVVPWMLANFGLHRVLLVLPLCMLLGSLAWGYSGGLFAGLVLIGADGSLRHTLQQTALELHFVPVPKDARNRVKAWIDGLGRRSGQAVASLAILGLISLQPPTWAIASLACALAGGWLLVSRALKDPYVELFRSKLSGGTLKGNGHLPSLDVGSLEALLRGLNSADDAVVLGSLELLEEEGKMDLVPALILYHPSRAVVIDALHRLERAGRTDVLGIAERLREHPDWEVRAAVARSRLRLSDAGEPSTWAKLDPHPAVRATAQVYEVLAGRAEPDSLESVLQSGEVEARMAMAQSLAEHTHEVAARLLIRLAEDAAPEVRLEAARAMKSVLHPEMFDALLQLLAHHKTRLAAREAFLKVGDDALSFLSGQLSNGQLPHPVRRHIPRTLSRFGSQRAADILLARMLEEPDGMIRFKLLRGLGRMHRDHPSLQLDPQQIRTLIERTLARIRVELRWIAALEAGQKGRPTRATECGQLLLDRLRDKEAKATARLLRLLDLSQPENDLERIARGLGDRRDDVRDSARELLENLLEPPLREVVVELVSSHGATTRLARAFGERASASYERALSELLDEQSESLSALAAYHAGELSLMRLLPKLDALSSEGSDLVREVAAASRQKLRDEAWETTA